MFGGFQMLQINKIKILITTVNGDYGFEESFIPGINFIASENNTCGKSSILESIYYCLGLEEIIGGKGDKVLTPVFKNTIEDGDKNFSVLESGIYLEINNGDEPITIFRAVKMQNRDSKLITVYHCELESINSIDTSFEDFYVHMQNSATNQNGFHSFLEKYLGLNLPFVFTFDDSSRKLYLQLIFSSMFIEQKRGWFDILSGMPYLGVKDSKKRVLEFILGLDALYYEQRKNQLHSFEYSIKDEWYQAVQDINLYANRENCNVLDLPNNPQIIEEKDQFRFHLVMNGEDHNSVPIKEYIEKLQKDFDNMKTKKPKVLDNFDELQIELQKTDDSIKEIEDKINKEKLRLHSELGQVEILIKNLDILNMDISNNKDAAKLRNLGANVNCQSSNNLCPVCHQSIPDSLFPNFTLPEMSIEENIRHLNAQKNILEYSYGSHHNIIEKIKNNIRILESNLFNLRKLARSIRNDLLSVDSEYSEAIVQKRLQVINEIENLNKLNMYVENKEGVLKSLSEKWSKYLKEKDRFPENRLSDMDQIKLKTLKDYFISNLSNYGYKSISDFNNISISEETYIPIYQNFDMKFDSSASDNIRAIWAYTFSLLQTSAELEGNHQKILIFDEPAQHSIVVNDMKSFFQSIINFKSVCQVFIGLTIKDIETKKAIESLDKEKYKLILIKSKAFNKIEN
jgi:hypothetical protein